MVEAVSRLTVGVVAVVKNVDEVVTCAWLPPRSVEINPAMRPHRQSILEREPEGATRVAIISHTPMKAFPHDPSEHIPCTRAVSKRNRVAC